MKRRLLLFFILFSSFAFGQNNIYRSGGITQTIGSPTFTPGASGNVVAIDTVTGEWYVNPNRLSGASWISAGYRLTNISGSVPPAYTPTAHQSHFVVNAANQLYYWNGSAWQSVGGGGGSTDALRLKFIVVNKSGGTINKGEVVYVSGAQGNRVAVKKALASQDSLSANTLGVMDETVANNAEGYCVAEGLISGINTSAFTEGAALYLSPTTAGGITQTKTTAPDHLVLIGYCVKSSAGSGEISVHIQNGYELGELHDVYVPTPANGQVLTYNTANTRWEAATVADQSATNELQTLSVAGNTATLSNSGGSVTIAGGGINTVGTVGSTITVTGTEVDGSISNELQTIDTFSLTGQTLRASLSNDNQAAKTVTLPVVGITAGTNVTVSESAGNFTINSTGGSSLSGVTGYVPHFNSTTTIDTTGLFWGNGSRLGIGTAAPGASLQINGAGATSGTSSLLINNSTPSELFRVANNGLISVGKNVSVTTQSSSQIVATSGDASTNVVITPKGNGAFVIGAAPDGTASGGNSRGILAIDMQLSRTANTQVSTGNRAAIVGGQRNTVGGNDAGAFVGIANTVSGANAVALGGQLNSAGGSRSAVLGGDSNNSSGILSVVCGGEGNTASAQYGLAAGRSALANLYASQAFASQQFAAQGDAMTLSWRYMRAITGTGITELFIDNSAARATLVANRLWNVNLQVSAICSTVGNGTLTLGDSYVATYNVGIKRLTNTTSLVGTVQNVTTAQSDTNMLSSAVTITADDTNEALKVEFTPPTTAGSTTVIRVVVTATATVVGY